MTITTSTFVITLVASIKDNRIDEVTVEKIEIQADDGPTFIPALDTHVPLTEAEKARTFDYIYADFQDGTGMQLVSVYDDRLRGFFTPSHKMGSNIRPAKGSVNIRSSRDVRNYRVQGYVLVKDID